jgi:hypothetical protein
MIAKVMSTLRTATSICKPAQFVLAPSSPIRKASYVPASLFASPSKGSRDTGRSSFHRPRLCKARKGNSSMPLTQKTRHQSAAHAVEGISGLRLDRRQALKDLISDVLLGRADCHAILSMSGAYALRSQQKYEFIRVDRTNSVSRAHSCLACFSRSRGLVAQTPKLICILCLRCCMTLSTRPKFIVRFRFHLTLNSTRLSE